MLTGDTRRPDAFVFLGDAAYTDVLSVPPLPVGAFYRRLLANADVARFLRHVPLYAMYDDHEIANDYKLGPDTSLYERRLATWLRYIGAQNPPSPDVGEQYFAFTFGPALRVFMADTRRYRGTPQALLGNKQRASLQHWLNYTRDDDSAVTREPLSLLATPSVTSAVLIRKRREGW